MYISLNRYALLAVSGLCWHSIDTTTAFIRGKKVAQKEKTTLDFDLCTTNFYLSSINPEIEESV